MQHCDRPDSERSPVFLCPVTTNNNAMTTKINEPPIPGALWDPTADNGAGRWVALCKDIAKGMPDPTSESAVSRYSDWGKIRRWGRYFDVLDSLQCEPGQGKRGPKTATVEDAK